jgi:hypothetical protein
VSLESSRVESRLLFTGHSTERERKKREHHTTYMHMINKIQARTHHQDTTRTSINSNTGSNKNKNKTSKTSKTNKQAPRPRPTVHPVIRTYSSTVAPNIRNYCKHTETRTHTHTQKRDPAKRTNSTTYLILSLVLLLLLL